MPQADYSLLRPAQQGINTPFENLGAIMALRNQQQAAQGMAEQRQAMAEQKREETERKRREDAAAAQVRSLFARPNQPPTPEELSSVVGPEAATKIFQGFEALRTATGANQDAARTRIASVLGAITAFPSDELRAKAYTGARAALIQDGTLKPEDAPETYEPAFVQNALRAALKPAEQIALDKPKPPIHVGDQLVNPDTMQPVYTAPPKPAALGSFEDYLKRYAEQRRLTPENLSAGDVRSAKAQFDAAGRAPKDATQEPLVPIIGPDGQPVLVPRSQAVGKRPASNREQGRPVTSGDAGRIADLDTSLDDLSVLRSTLTETKGATGTRAAIGAGVPAAVTDLTGWGTDAKKRQGVIDRVKQVIGKALEGGVLRKEDEYKYEKILPTIKDAQPVAASKLDGLEKALVLRRQTTLDALADAGYETSKFEARSGTRGGAPAGDEGGAAALLAGKPDGIYTLSDGSKWTVRGGKVSR